MSGHTMTPDHTPLGADEWRPFPNAAKLANRLSVPDEVAPDAVAP